MANAIIVGSTKTGQYFLMAFSIRSSPFPDTDYEVWKETLTNPRRPVSL
jgi:hypothetical protein